MCALAFGLHFLREVDLQPARDVQAVVAGEDVGDAAFAGLAVDAHDILVAAADVEWIDGQVSDVPDTVLRFFQRFFDGVLMRAGEGGEDEFANVGVTRMHRQVVAFADDVDDVVHAREVEAGVDALAVEVHRHNHDVHVAGAFAVAEQRAFNAVSACHYCKFGGGNGAAAVVVGVDADHDVFAAGEFAAEVFDLVSVEVRRAGLHRVRQVEDDFAPCPRLPDVADGFADGDGEIRLGLRETLRRVFKNPLAAGVARGALLQHGRTRNGDGGDFRFVFLVNLVALDFRGGVIDVHDGAFDAL